ncbi:uncharacterized protein LOC115441579 [Manduca sexta]|uniref:uncharacterized protein LOC115441579 n=1 Tax=Manduca sexta TaxID=7130 RepID=UPI00188F76E5|nr:uncharacterized protein LOC115441579 [Manduca sexta]
MEGMVTQRVTPLLKCIVLFLFIFTAKVLTSRPQESQETRNGIHQVKPLHYVRTFTKYHHRRTIQWNSQDLNNYWPVQDQKHVGKRSTELLQSDIDDFYDWPKEKLIRKRSINFPFSTSQTSKLKRNNDLLYFKKNLLKRKRSVVIPDSNEFIANSEGISNLNQLASESVKGNIINAIEKKAINSGKEDQSMKNGVPNYIKKYKVKAAMVVTSAPTTIGPTISCLYKRHNVAISVTPSYDDERNAQLMVENKSYDTGPISETTLPNGETVEVEHCTDPRASCYTLWLKQDEGNITVLGQGCWWSSQTQGRSSCDKCTRVSSRLPGTNFCCCTKSFCNADFRSLKEETVTMKAESTMNTTSQQPSYSNVIASGILALVSILVMAVVGKVFCCKRVDIDKDDMSDGVDVEKGDVMGSGPDALATGLLCVDNLPLIERIGQGKFGSVWRGSLGSTPVAVKLYSNANAWQKEAAIYTLPNLSHPNLLRYYGSECRSSLTGGAGSQLVVLELCAGSLRALLAASTLSWQRFASLAHGLASALAHLHSPSGNKPCVVHRDVNSNNVLISSNGEARLADLGLAQAIYPRRDTTPSRITEAGTIRYLSPEALEGALDVRDARAALCAVDVFALALVLWEMLWRTAPAHAHRTPPYAPPYHHHGLPHHPTLHQMQTLVSRNKARPPLPKGPVPDARVLKIASDTCDECWDHDAEARLTAVCVEERMAELKQMLQAPAPLIHDNNLHPNTNLPADVHVSPLPETDKNSNCTIAQNSDASTPLLYPQPHIGRNACIERNTHNKPQHTDNFIHKSLKDITAPTDMARVPNAEETYLSVARETHTRPQIQENSGMNEIRSYQRPLEYVPNDVSSQDVVRGPKQTNLLQDKTDKSKWGIRKFFEKFNKNKLETEVKLVPESVQKTKISVVNDKPSNNIPFNRPSNLVLNQNQYNFEAPCLSPPNKTLSPTMMSENNGVLGFKELPARDNEAKTPSQIFAVIVPKAKPVDFMEMRSKTSRGSSESLNKHSVRTSMSSQSMFKSNSESEDSTVKKRLSCDNKIITNSNSGRSSRASINLELQYIDNQENYNQVSPFELNSDCSSSEDEHLMLLSENGGSKITMQTVPKQEPKYQNEVLKESSQAKTVTFNKFQNKYTNFDNEFSDPNDKENLVNGYSGDNPVYLAALNGEIDTDFKFEMEKTPKSPKPSLKSLSIKRQHSLEQVSDIFASSGDLNLQNPAGRVKTPGDLPVAIRRARRDRVLQKGRASECNRLSLYDDRMMFGNSL